MIQQNKSLGSLNSIHTKIVVTPIDKASRNVAFIYKRFFALVLMSLFYIKKQMA